MRVTPLHLPLEVSSRFVRRELPSFLGEHQLPGQVKEQVADFLPDIRRVALAEGVVQLHDLLDQVRPKRLPGLHPVPGTAGPEIRDHRHRASKR
jgi:hypothetical protein